MSASARRVTATRNAGYVPHQRDALECSAAASPSTRLKLRRALRCAQRSIQTFPSRAKPVVPDRFLVATELSRFRKLGLSRAPGRVLKADPKSPSPCRECAVRMGASRIGASTGDDDVHRRATNISYPCQRHFFVAQSTAWPILPARPMLFTYSHWVARGGLIATVQRRKHGQQKE